MAAFSGIVREFSGEFWGTLRNSRKVAAGIYVKVAAWTKTKGLLQPTRYVGIVCHTLHRASQDPIGPALGPHRSRFKLGLPGNPT
jgi:hypothetical protein